MALNFSPQLFDFWQAHVRHHSHFGISLQSPTIASEFILFCTSLLLNSPLWAKHADSKSKNLFSSVVCMQWDLEKRHDTALQQGSFGLLPSEGQYTLSNSRCKCPAAPFTSVPGWCHHSPHAHRWDSPLLSVWQAATGATASDTSHQFFLQSPLVKRGQSKAKPALTGPSWAQLPHVQPFIVPSPFPGLLSVPCVGQLSLIARQETQVLITPSCRKLSLSFPQDGRHCELTVHFHQDPLGFFKQVISGS